MKKCYLFLFFLILLLTSADFSFPRVDAAEIVYTEGKVQVQFGKDKIWRGAKTGMRMDSGDSLKTARRSQADIALGKDNFIRVQEQTLVVFDSTTPGLINKFDLSQGELYANVESIREGLSFEVSTPSSVVGVRGTGWYVKSDLVKDEILVHEGTVFVKTFDKRKQLISEVTIFQGFKTIIERYQPPGPLEELSREEMVRLKQIKEEVLKHIEEGLKRGETTKSTTESSGIQKEIEQISDFGENIEKINEIKEQIEESFGPESESQEEPSKFREPDFQD